MPAGGTRQRHVQPDTAIAGPRVISFNNIVPTTTPCTRARASSTFRIGRRKRRHRPTAPPAPSQSRSGIGRPLAAPDKHRGTVQLPPAATPIGWERPVVTLGKNRYARNGVNLSFTPDF